MRTLNVKVSRGIPLSLYPYYLEIDKVQIGKLERGQTQSFQISEEMINGGKICIKQGSVRVSPYYDLDKGKSSVKVSGNNKYFGILVLYVIFFPLLANGIKDQNMLTLFLIGTPILLLVFFFFFLNKYMLLIEKE